jgi:hypothetical protein
MYRSIRMNKAGICKDQVPEDPALIIPGGDGVYCNLSGSGSNGVLE